MQCWVQEILNINQNQNYFEQIKRGELNRNHLTQQQNLICESQTTKSSITNIAILNYDFKTQKFETYLNINHKIYFNIVDIRSLFTEFACSKNLERNHNLINQCILLFTKFVCLFSKMVVYADPNFKKEWIIIYGK